jgi:anaerobic selenocysteine-containing dehydrogenase
VASLPDSREVARAFETREFVVVADSFLTDTARRATLVLPTTTLLEDEDVMGAYGHHYLASSRPVARRPGGVKTDLEIAQLLAGRIDALSGSRIAETIAGTHEAWKRRLLRNVEPLGATLEAIESAPVRNPLAPHVLWPDRRFPTATGRMQLITALAPAAPHEPGFPLWLFSNAHEHSQCTQWADPMHQPPPATCHPEAAPGFRDGEVVWIESALGRMKAKLKFDHAQRKDLVIVPKGGHLDVGTCANALVRARLTDAGEGAAYMDCRVRILKKE